MQAKFRFLVLILACLLSSKVLAADQISRSFIERLASRSDNIEVFLSKLPNELRENFTLAYESRSPFRDSISFQKPRVVLFSTDGKVILTFTGERTKPGSDVLEALYFNSAEAKFETGAYVLPRAIRERGPTAHNEVQSCARCHSEDTKPIFDSYPVWPGFYGSVKDTFPANIQLSVTEREQLDKFVREQSATGVYRFLKFPKGSPVSPYMDPAKVIAGSVEGDPKQFPFMPNTRLGMALTELNRKRIFRKIAKSPHYQTKTKAILRELLECDLRTPASLDQQKIEASLTRENSDRLARLKIKTESAEAQIVKMEEFKFQHALSQLDWLVKDLQLDPSDWSMALEANSLSYFDGILSGIFEKQSYYIKEDFIFEMLRDLAYRDTSFFRFFRVKPVFAVHGYPFGHRLDIGQARGACAKLSTNN